MNVRTRRGPAAVLLGLLCLLPPLQAAAQATAAVAIAPATRVRVVVVASGLEHPWAVAPLPGDDPAAGWLVTERPGRLRLVSRDGRVGPALAGLPPVDARGQGGLLDVVLHPGHASNRLVYWSYSEAGDGASNGTAVARGRLDLAGQRLEDVQVVFRQQPKVDSSAHFGSRLVFDRSGRLFVTLGDRFSRKDDAQQPGNHLGKIVRIEADGRAPTDTPAPVAPGALPELWSWGHRNVQGAALHPDSGELWATEHGPQGGDELNRVERGRNHGWPVITYGRHYGIGTRIGEGERRADVVEPLRVWRPTSIAPSGLAFVTSPRYPGWQGSLLLGALRGQALLRLTLAGTRVVQEERLLESRGERIRDVRQGPDGWIYLLSDRSDGQLLRLVPESP
ncbi:glucose/arabinose dehydrogenase [Sphaerotilus hippei]|uniref:Glucose/arabinose dehydrogenase n=1 Tax=Sphaerotilus hippei TaxID=744406 RepID=A0A318GX52_9BURK|nr:PQQ-dependent sugar dehydrogenase [Sphaerotilus hippei]PXW94199.1 glucose/arabinose dehydrogenase [Sphaerotilus hippei]